NNDADENDALLREMLGISSQPTTNLDSRQDSQHPYKEATAPTKESPHLLPPFDHHLEDEAEDIPNISGIAELDDLDDVLDAAGNSSLDEFSSDDEEDEQEDDEGALFMDLDESRNTLDRLDTSSVRSVSHLSLTDQQLEAETAAIASLLATANSATTMNSAVAQTPESTSGGSNLLRRRRLFPSLPQFRSSQRDILSSSGGSSNALETADHQPSSSSSLNNTPPTWRAATSRRLRQIPRRIRRNVGNVATATTAATSLVAIGAVLLLAVLWVVKMRGWSWLPKFWQLVARRGGPNGASGPVAGGAV
ncbi:UNVERIFIED_CONTAM: hypothetical protein HDU68_007340, partial [Siphonaria sp. JEL0065]